MEDREDILLHMPTITKLVANKKVILEIAPDFGNGSTKAILKGISPDAVWISVDITDHINSECRPQILNWKMVEGDSRLHSTVSKVKELILDFPADFIFIDTIHEKDFLAQELEVWCEVADEDTLWLFHDTWMLGNYNTMTDAIKEFAEKNPQWKYIDLSEECNGLGALIPVTQWVEVL